MKYLPKTLTFLFLLFPALAFGEPVVWIKNTVISDKFFYLVTKKEIIPEGGDLFISDKSVPEYTIDCQGNECQVNLVCVFDGRESPEEIRIQYRLGYGITDVLGACVSSGSVFLPKWDHIPFGEISVVKYAPKK